MYLPIVSLLLTLYLTVLLLRVVREDDLCGKIRNRSLARGGAAVLAAAAVMLSVSVAGTRYGLHGPFWEPFFVYRYYLVLLENAALGLLAGIILWKTAVWPAGDAKLFALLCAALPMVISYASWAPVALVLSLLVNIFVPPAAVYFAQMSREQLGLLFSDGTIKAFGKSWAAARAAAAGLAREPGRLVTFSFSALLFSFVSAWNSAHTGGFQVNSNILFILMFALGGRVGWLAGKAGPRALLAGLLLLAVASRLNPETLSLARLVLYGFVMSMEFMLFRGVLYAVADRHLALSGTRRVCLDSLTPGMIISEEYLQQLREAEPELAEKYGFDRYRDGLTAEQLEGLKEYVRSKAADSKDDVGVPVFHVRPFAFWIVAGLAVTAALSGGNVLLLAKIALRRLWSLI
ncbi:MAG: hypothetical protein M0011_11990 [Elusimicrobia bacterium]|nr:hypothetical protein [Elusimicrobiota bacterium]